MAEPSSIPPLIWPAIFSAVAAIASAVSAFLTYKVHRDNRRDSVRPELLLTGWSRSFINPDLTTLSVSAIQNIGRGPAMQVTINAYAMLGNKVFAQAATVSREIIPVGEPMDIHFTVSISWKTIAEHSGRSNRLVAGFPIAIRFFDSHNHMHYIEYNMVVLTNEPDFGVSKGMSVVAPWVAIGYRKTETVLWWQLRRERRKANLKNTLSRLFTYPGFRDSND